MITTRRELLRLSTAAALGAGVAQRLWAQSDAKELLPLNRFTRMVHEFFDEQIRIALEAGLKRKAALQSRADAEGYVQFVRQKIRESFGPFPEKTPLKPRITGVVERDAYRIEKVLFESRPEFLVTANLYVPKERKLPLPGVVGSCGHSANGKAAGAYQSFAQGLARQGYVVLIFDPIGQGERLQYPNEKLESEVGVGVREHLSCGNQQYLVGEFFGAWRAWDGIRALDYLLSRPEVDPKHVGITGNSGGGTLTMWLTGLEPRWTMSAPSCAVTSFRRNFQNELPTDTEQCPPKILALGLDHDDFLAALAPKPVIIMAQEKDYFDARGSEAAYQRLRKLYALLGAEQNIRLHVGPDEHGYSQPNREAMYGFFNEQTKVAEGKREPELTLEKDETLQVTPRGQVSELSAKTVMDFTQARSKEFWTARSPANLSGLRLILPGALKIHSERPAAPPEYRILRVIGGRKLPKPAFTTYAVETEPGIEAIVYRLTNKAQYSRPTTGSPRCVLYVSHHSADTELRNENWLAELIASQPDVPFYACDVRGIGESRPDTCGVNQFLSPYGNDYFYASNAIMLDRPMPGQRTWDVLRVLDWLASLGHREVHLVALGWGTIPATFAAVLSDTVAKITLKNALTSYHLLAEAEHYAWPLSALPPGILQKCDIADCYRVLEDRDMTMIEPWGPDAKPA
jgi:cephalosporin-C deacetylase-like acetyl esterase/pimeloyl-ACP methyl ester carboxylesterase